MGLYPQRDPVKRSGNLNGRSASVAGANFGNFPHILSRKVTKSRDFCSPKSGNLRERCPTRQKSRVESQSKS